MVRRIPKHKTGLIGTGTVNYQQVYRVFQCFNPKCKNFIEILEQDIDFENIEKNKFICPKCKFSHDISLDASHVEGYFEKFLNNMPQWKYCRICENIKPLASFDRHKRMPSDHQMECKTCKWQINSILNPLRTKDQLREGSEGRRLLEIFRGQEKIKTNEKQIKNDFNNKCFKCGIDLSMAKRGEYHIDHVLPAKYLWRLEDGTALLCRSCNLEKREKWPSEFYSLSQLKDLSLRIGIPFKLLASKKPKVNPSALKKVKENIDDIYKELASRPREMKKLRNIILEIEGIDVLDFLKKYNKNKVIKILNEV